MRYYLAAVIIVLFAIASIITVSLQPGKKSTTKTVSTSQNSSKSTPAGPVKLLDYENEDAMLVATLQGRLIGNESRRSIRITVTPSYRSLEILEGYDEVVIDRHLFSNNQNAYVSFLKAVNNAGFVNKRNSLTTDERGVCPHGQTYIFELFNAKNQSVSRLWSVSCAANIGPFAGSAQGLILLFQNQITGYPELTATTIL